MENTAAIAANSQVSLSPSVPSSLNLSLPPLPLALFGVGRWGTHLLRNFLSHPQAQVVAIIDPSADRLAALPEQFGLKEQITKKQIVLSTDWEAALQHPALEAVVMATPATTHYSLIRSALQHSCHVLAEKPLTLNVAESYELCHLAAQQQRQLVIDHTYLFHPAVQQGHIVLQQNLLGELRYGYAARTHLGPVRQDVDALWDLAIHDIAIFNYWLNETPSQVQAQGTTWLQPHLPHPLSSLASGLSDLVWVTLTYPSGFQAFIHLCWSNADKQRRLSVVGNQGTLVFDELAAAPLVLLHGHLVSTNGQFIPTAPQQQVLEFASAEPLQAVCSHFLTCAQQNIASWISPGWLGANLVQVLVALTRSLHEGGKIVEVGESNKGG